MFMLRHFSVLVLISLVFTMPIAAQDKGKTILVLDASGSMWGQIDGLTKIEIAQKVVGGLLDDLPDDQELGLTVYGHNRKGDCADIETLVLPGLGTRDAIRTAVNAIKPKGKTPLSEAVIKAAEALKYTENKATVILVSDGKETCDFDPCEVGRKLEESGVDFTAHVVGFDVANPADRAQLQCLAENTGGQFLTASTASELTEALQKVSVPEPPKPVQVTFQAIEEGSLTIITEGLVWSLTNLDDGTALDDYITAATISRELLPGKYMAEVLRTSDESSAEKTVTIGPDSTATVLLELPEFTPKATLNTPAEAPVGSSIELGWTGPNESGDFISTAEIGTRATKYLTYIATKKGNPARLQMPAIPGRYDIRYLHRGTGKVIASNTINVTPVEASLGTGDTGPAGASVMVEWTGPNYRSDYISIAEIGSRGSKYINYTYTNKGTPLPLQLPIEPGNYELRYVMSQDATVIARRNITVENVQAGIIAPETAAAGALILVEWQGPDYKSDYLSVAQIGAKDSKYENYTYTNQGSPLRLLMPAQDGEYEIRYVASQGSTVLARKPILIEPIGAQITFPDTASIGEPLLVQWTGPDYKNDFISVAEVGQPDSKYLGYTYTRQGTPLRLKLPLTPGDYEIRYVQSQDSTVLVREPIKVVALEAKLSAADNAGVAEPLLVQWEGPDYNNDYISVAQIGQPDSKYVNYTYTRQGSPLRVIMPAQPGDYELRYIANGSPDMVLARREVTVEAVDATVALVGDALAGQPALVEWSGPDYRNDYIGVSLVGDAKYVHYTYTREGSPLRVKMPDAPGKYELRYFLAEGRTVIASEPIEVK